MTSIFTRPMFPLEIVVFPQETIALHIFEQRYKDLVQDCLKSGMTFGIPVVMDGKLNYGTEVKLHKIVNEYEDGAMDVVFKALRAFKIERFYKDFNGKSYSGADVSFLDNEEDGLATQRLIYIDLLKQLYNLLKISIPEIDINKTTSFTYAHKLGLTLSQEYHLLTMKKESERLKYLQDHLNISIPVLQQMEKAKEVARLNGHIKNFDPLDFSDLAF